MLLLSAQGGHAKLSPDGIRNNLRGVWLKRLLVAQLLELFKHVRIVLMLKVVGEISPAN